MSRIRLRDGLKTANGLLLLLALLMAVSCGGGGGGDSSDGFTTSDYQFLYVYNAVNLSGHTIRWPNLPITVSASAFPTAQAAFQRWTSASDGRVSFNFGGGSNISVAWSSSTAWCGLTTVAWNSAGQIVDADILIARNQVGCRDGTDSTIAHEAGHAIGFLGHDASGLMNPYGGGDINDQEGTFAKLLYTLSPGTDISNKLGQSRSDQQSRYDKTGAKIYSMTLQ